MFKFSRLKFLRSLEFLQEHNEDITKHYPVMYREVLERVNSTNHINLLDCTIGTGAHSQFLMEKLPNISILGLDIDERMISNLPKTLSAKQDNFINFDKYQPLDGSRFFDVIFADLGYNMNQVLDSSYGLSYRNDSKLDMRYSNSMKYSAADLLNYRSQQELREIFSTYGDIFHANKLAKKIIEQRQVTKIEKANQLIRILNDLEMGDQIMQTFQSLRIAVNQEIKNLKTFLDKIPKQQITDKQQILIITFHSLEADTVQKFASMNKKQIKIRTFKPSQLEIEENPRSRSAKLFELIYKPHN